ncbi:uncharacterized protein FRV6_16684 [Fusarium oxysporum]|uniref:Uncharacterized protein n=1 Tax=Fusarium oxysporum TaxID=5507 RepID=A0A2H3UBA1_FUSOX|nr:uncharacterized protein FRV6_16684 [Fusarium oxysporum]
MVQYVVGCLMKLCERLSSNESFYFIKALLLCRPLKARLYNSKIFIRIGT